MSYNWGSLGAKAAALTVPFWGLPAGATAGAAAIFGGAGSAFDILGTNERAEGMKDDLKEKEERLKKERIRLNEDVEAEKKESFMDAVNAMRANPADTSKVRSNYAQKQAQTEAFETKQESEIGKGVARTEDAIENIDSEWDIEDTLGTLGGAAVAGATSYAGSQFKDVLKEVGEDAIDVAGDVVEDVGVEFPETVTEMAEDAGQVARNIVKTTTGVDFSLDKYFNEIIQSAGPSFLI